MFIFRNVDMFFAAVVRSYNSFYFIIIREGRGKSVDQVQRLVSTRHKSIGVPLRGCKTIQET